MEHQPIHVINLCCVFINPSSIACFQGDEIKTSSTRVFPIFVVDGSAKSVTSRKICGWTWRMEPFYADENFTMVHNEATVFLKQSRNTYIYEILRWYTKWSYHLSRTSPGTYTYVFVCPPIFKYCLTCLGHLYATSSISHRTILYLQVSFIQQSRGACRKSWRKNYFAS